ncbi:9405_t:CDS:2 [Ambispora leptoticha]|uniref:9405_t:CDS:1 n=1 Tax=Ambispora leptoticha TaxID=144679 RepID=A0A9N9ABJ7_9GLOM|nr:9405_t:CDS:2 [Ambispora leptoticha]
MAISKFSIRKIFTLGLVSLLVCGELLSNTRIGIATYAVPITNGDTSPESSSTSSTPAIMVSPADDTQFKFWVKYASAAYCNVEGWNCGVACQGVTAQTRLLQYFDQTVNKAYVAANDQKKSIVVAFRGTADIEGFMQDSQFYLTDYPGITGAKIHAGFLNTFQMINKNVTNFVKEIVPKYPGYNVILTGHSLGGAMAILQLLEFVNIPGLSRDNLFVYTYGEPRIGNDVFAKYVENLRINIFRVVNKNDLIPHLPPRAFTYIQHSPEFFVHSNNTMFECPVAEDINCSNSLTPNFDLIAHANYFDTAFVITCLAKK